MNVSGLYANRELSENFCDFFFISVLHIETAAFLGIYTSKSKRPAARKEMFQISRNNGRLGE